jgi:hypothetical protein
MLTTKLTVTWGRHYHTLMGHFCSFVCHDPWPLTSFANVNLSKSTMLFMPMRNSGKCLSFAVRRSVFIDNGKQVTYACVGPQVLRNSQKVLNYPLFMEKLPNYHWDSLVWLMQHAEMCFEIIADHQVISHIHHTKKVVPFKTMSGTSNGSCLS